MIYIGSALQLGPCTAFYIIKCECFCSFSIKTGRGRQERGRPCQLPAALHPLLVPVTGPCCRRRVRLLQLVWAALARLLLLPPEEAGGNDPVGSHWKWPRRTAAAGMSNVGVWVLLPATPWALAGHRVEITAIPHHTLGA